MSAPVRRIVSRKENAAGGIYDLACGHSVAVRGDDYDECVMWEWPCQACGKLGPEERASRDQTAVAAVRELERDA